MRTMFVRCFAVALALGALACGSDDGGEVMDGGSNADATVTISDGGDAGMDPCGSDPTCPNPLLSCLHPKIFNAPVCSACHSPAISLGGFGIPTNKDAAHPVLLANSVSFGVNKPRIAPNNVVNSFLHEKLLPNPSVGTQMPQGSMLPQCQIDAIRMWIEAGAPNN